MPSTTSPDLATIRAYINRHGGYAAFATANALNPRTAERIFSGATAAPQWLIDQMEAAQP